MINASRSGNNANNEILALKMKNEETEKSLKRLEKLLMKSKNEQQEIIKSKNKEIKTINQKLIEAEKRKLMEDKKASAALQVFIIDRIMRVLFLIEENMSIEMKYVKNWSQ